MNIEKERPYKCGVCQKGYKNPNGLTYHRMHSPPCMFPDSYINGCSDANPLNVGIDLLFRTLADA